MANVTAASSEVAAECKRRVSGGAGKVRGEGRRRWISGEDVEFLLRCYWADAKCRVVTVILPSRIAEQQGSRGGFPTGELGGKIHVKQ